MAPLNLKRSSPWALACLTILFFLALLFILEGLARLPVSRKISPYMSVGNYHYQFEFKWFRLQNYVEQNGGVDIIFLGSSLVNTGVDPDIVAKIYYEKTGIQARIFNFGVEGLTVSPNSMITELLVKRYHPALIVYVTEMRDFIAGNGMETETNFLFNPWIQYKLGNFDPIGWLTDNSVFLQHYLPFRNWTRPDFPETMSIIVNRYHDMSSSGYEPDKNVEKNIDSPSDPVDLESELNFPEFGNYQIAPSRVTDLIDILEVGKKDRLSTSILVVEMPVQPDFYSLVGGEQVHQQFQLTISSIVGSHGGFFLPSQTCLDTIPLNGYSNLWHLNYIGAPSFSNCLGEQLTILARQKNSNFIQETNTIMEVP